MVQVKILLLYLHLPVLSFPNSVHLTSGDVKSILSEVFLHLKDTVRNVCSPTYS